MGSFGSSAASASASPPSRVGTGARVASRGASSGLAARGARVASAVAFVVGVGVASMMLSTAPPRAASSTSGDGGANADASIVAGGGGAPAGVGTSRATPPGPSTISGCQSVPSMTPLAAASLAARA
eukprot:31211-Pelagococcus_subviridis.AAC.4